MGQNRCLLTLLHTYVLNPIPLSSPKLEKKSYLVRYNGYKAIAVILHEVNRAWKRNYIEKPQYKSSKPHKAIQGDNTSSEEEEYRMGSGSRP